MEGRIRHPRRIPENALPAEPGPRQPGPVPAWRSPLAWAALLLLSLVFSLLLQAAQLPAALLLGPLAAGIAVASAGGTVRLPREPLLVGQGVIALLIARAFTPAIVSTVAADWPLFIGVILAVIAASSGLGWVLARLQVLPGTVAVWGASPGAATTMVLMAEAYGADARLVAFMQYTRVVFVTVAASIVAHLGTVAAGGEPPAVAWFPPLPAIPFAMTLVLGAGGAFLGRALRIPAGALLVPMVVGGALQGAGLVEIVLPPWLLAASYALVGWNIGLSFTRTILQHAARAFLPVAASIILQIVLCMGLAALLWRFAGADPLTAYLATSPGGMDSVAIIAASSNVDMPFVMALQAVRLVLVMLLSPGLSRLVARTLQPPA